MLGPKELIHAGTSTTQHPPLASQHQDGKPELFPDCLFIQPDGSAWDIHQVPWGWPGSSFGALLRAAVKEYTWDLNSVFSIS